MGAPCRNTILPVPKHPQKFTIIWMDWNEAKCRLYVRFSHVAALAKVLNWCDGLVNSNILEGEIILFDKIIDARGLRLRVG